MDEGVKRMEEGNNLPLDDDAKNEVLKKQETTNINGDSDIKQQIAEQDDQQPVLLVKQKTKRVATLDAFRGLTIVLMILVDDAGGAYSRIDHSPWNGCTLADFVMPFFLFIVGVAIALALKKIPKINYTVKKIILRTLKLLFWGILLQGGYSHAPDELVYGVNMKFIRWCGILQVCFELNLMLFMQGLMQNNHINQVYEILCAENSPCILYCGSNRDIYHQA
ncbi:putative heparan-alpha-glucosaminide N-acetyltransferase [Medicago truncatula]|uniref:Putative heparan-alpha-glucosaminide N-acetyltransferase n=1 Tax=Medicago truncatula TaxID=3880 RepID=A0A396HBA0_MEDTR|nr:putative heparan-alpha-glucosaminide N-acetyltransferase [Medicago truncatula]